MNAALQWGLVAIDLSGGDIHKRYCDVSANFIGSGWQQHFKVCLGGGNQVCQGSGCEAAPGACARFCSNWLGSRGYVDLSAIQDIIRRTGQQILDQAAKLAENSGLMVEMELLESYGKRIPTMIIEATRNWPADLIVIGTHGWRGFDHLLLGSVAEAVMRTAPVPVLLIRAS